MKPYRKNKILPKLKAEKTRLARVYVSQVSPEVKKQMKIAARAIGQAMKLLRPVPEAND